MPEDAKGDGTAIRAKRQNPAPSVSILVEMEGGACIAPVKGKRRGNSYRAAKAQTETLQPEKATMWSTVYNNRQTVHKSFRYASLSSG